jgi:hypothetical protein
MNQNVLFLLQEEHVHGAKAARPLQVAHTKIRAKKTLNKYPKNRKQKKDKREKTGIFFKGKVGISL